MLPQDLNPESPAYKTDALTIGLQEQIGDGRIELPFPAYQTGALTDVLIA